MDLTIVVPAHNEGARLGSMLVDLAAFCDTTALSTEVIVVDDGSTDHTATIARAHARPRADWQVVSLPDNVGKGRAVAAGMAHGRGRYRAFIDADGATPAPELAKLVDLASSGPRRVVIGSIRTRGATVVHRQPLGRRLAGRAANRFIQWAVLPGVGDTQRGVKVLPAELADAVFPDLDVRGWAFDVELLARCKLRGYEIIEAPIVWRHREHGGVRAGSYVRAFCDVLALRRRLAREATGATATLLERTRRTATGLAPLEHH